MLSIAWAILFGCVAIACFVLAMMAKKARKELLGSGAAMGVITLILFILSMVVTIPPGHAGVAVLFGEVQPTHYMPGLHFANPLLEWRYYDCRQKTHMETMEVPSKDQLLTSMDVSVQFKIQDTMTPTILNETGTVEDVINIHMIPTLRSVLREQGKTVENAENFFLDETQQRVQAALLSALTDKLTPKGMIVQEILLRDIKLPQTIRIGVEAKKKREQEAEQQKAELRRFETEQQQKVATAKAEREAAEEEAKKKMVLADAQAYEIQKINEAIAENPAYIQLEALKALQAISKDPNAKIYFLNGDSPQPLPLMHMGTESMKKAARGEN